MFLTGARRGDLVTSMDLVTFGVFILLENHGCATLCVSLLRVFAYHESFLRLGATDLGCVGDFLTVEPLWLHHRTVFFRGLPHFGTHVHSAPHLASAILWSRLARGTVELFRLLPRIGVFAVCHDCGRTSAWNFF